MRSSSSTDRRQRSLLIPLDSAEATDARTVGAKAAALAQARRAGLPALPGFVLPVAQARSAVLAGSVAAEDRGPAAARRAVLDLTVPADLAAELADAVDRLGGRVIIRSSSPLESDHRWSGAFSSINEIERRDVAVAVRSCWASAYAPDPLERAEKCGVRPDQLGVAVLLQPELTPTAGGLARVVDDRVRVTGVAGHPGALLAGWVAGQTAWVGGPDPEPPALTCIAVPTAHAVADLARRVYDTLGHDTIEWAEAAGELHLLQSSRSEAPAPSAATLPETLTGAQRRVSGTPSVAGDAVGKLRYVRPHEGAPTGGPHILVCERPVPALAPLLFGAAGLVSLNGPEECHLVEVARSLGVPVLVDAPVEGITGPLSEINAADWLAAIDGARNELVVLPQGAGDSPDLPSAIRKFASPLAPSAR
nr:PEP/pyruvate-binding domain-containing protein [Micromonospora sp. DSM 115978]